MVLNYLLAGLFLLYHCSKSDGGPLPEKLFACGYESCPKVDPTKLNVHLVPHTHDDVGWLKTVDQYFYGSKTRIQKAGVQYIIDSVVAALRQDPNRRFIYVETAFLWKWWQRQTPEIQAEVRKYINEGRLEMIGGAWSMNDEATTHYHSIVDQFTWGFRRLNDTFGECARPKVGWQIDPFGHSREQASIFAQLGFDGMFLGRLDHQDKSQRLKNKSAEFLWHASSSLGEEADLFTGALYNTYSPPPGFCFDVLCSDDPLIDNPESPDNNIEAKVNAFVNYCQRQSESYITNNIIITMGEDFNYQDANMWFKNLDKLIKYTNKFNGSKVNTFYSTPSCYLKALHDAKKTWPTKSDDFFPYSSDPHAFWTGYFTSRPTLKYFERMGNNLLQVVKQLAVTSSLPNPKDSFELEDFREAMGVMQHHDAVTGTEKQHVAEDYARLLYKRMNEGLEITSKTLGRISAKDSSVAEDFKSCLLMNISSCSWTEESEYFVVTLYNPTSQFLSTYARLPVAGSNYTVRDPTREEMTTQLVPIPQFVLNMPGRTSKATKELVFHATDIPPLGYKSFYVSRKPSEKEVTPSRISSIGGDLYNITVGENASVLIQWKHEDLKIVQSFNYYEGMKGNNSGFDNRASGAYIFRPKESRVHNFAAIGTHNFFKGPLVEELHLTVNNFTGQIVRVYKGEERIEFDWVVGPIPVNDSVGREIITTYSSNLQSNGVFFTDSNGREMLKRVKNYRPTWKVNLDEPISGNYYPVTSKIYLQDEKKNLRVSLMNDRAQGGTSMNDGDLEIMLHRRLLNDDAFGVAEALNEQAFGTGLVARGTHYLTAGKLNDLVTTAKNEKSSEINLALRPWYFFTPTGNSFNEWNNQYFMEMHPLVGQLPFNIRILTLEPWKNNVLLRLEHLFEVGQAGVLSEPVKVVIKNLFARFEVTSIRETTLGGNQWIEDMKRFRWDSGEESNEVEDYSYARKEINEDPFEITMKPMEIRTFILTFRALP